MCAGWLWLWLLWLVLLLWLVVMVVDKCFCKRLSRSVGWSSQSTCSAMCCCCCCCTVNHLAGACAREKVNQKDAWSLPYMTHSSPSRTDFLCFLTLSQSELRIRHREECKNVTRLTMENVRACVSVRLWLPLRRQALADPIQWLDSFSGFLRTCRLVLLLRPCCYC